MCVEVKVYLHAVQTQEGGGGGKSHTSVASFLKK
jgi:hypothetical protein